MGKGFWTLLSLGAIGASVGAAMWYLSLPAGGAYVLHLLPYSFNFLGFMMLIMLFVVPPASVIGAVGASVIWLLNRRRRTGISVWLRVTITTAISTAVAAPLAVHLIPRPYELTPGAILGYRLLCGAMIGVGVGLATGSKRLQRAVGG